MEQIFNIGLTTKILSDTIGLSAFNSADGRRFYDANKKKIQRMKDFDIKNMKPKDFENYQSYIKKVDEWAEWAKKQGYLSGFQQTALSDFYMTMFEAASVNMPINKNMTEHFFCYALAKVLYNQIQEYKTNNPKESKYEAMYWMLSNFDFFGDDDEYKKDFSPIASSFSLLACWVNDLNKVIKFWENKIAENGKRDNSPNLKSYINKWKNGSTPSWAIVQLFFDNDLCPPSDYFIEDPDIQKNVYKTFKTNLYMAFVLTNLFDSLVKNKILTNESRMMIRNGAKMYYRDFYVVRNEQNPDFSEKFEPEAKDNLMFRTLFCMLDGTLNRITTEEFLDIVYQNPECPILLD